jgi:hypothetical protein
MARVKKPKVGPVQKKRAKSEFKSLTRPANKDTDYVNHPDTTTPARSRSISQKSQKVGKKPSSRILADELSEISERSHCQEQTPPQKSTPNNSPEPLDYSFLNGIAALNVPDIELEKKDKEIKGLLQDKKDMDILFKKQNEILNKNKRINQRRSSISYEFAKDYFKLENCTWHCKFENCLYSYRTKPNDSQEKQSLRNHLAGDRHWSEVEAILKNKKSLSIAEMLINFSWAKSFPSMRKSDVCSFMLTYIIMTTNIAFRFIDNDMLNILFGEFLGYKLCSRRTMLRSYLPGISETVHNLTIEVLFTAKSKVHLSFDIWSGYGFGFLGLVGHFVDKSWAKSSLSLGCMPFSGISHTAANIARYLQTAIGEYSLEGKVGSMISDSASNCCSCVLKILKFPFVRCVLHQ